MYLVAFSGMPIDEVAAAVFVGRERKSNFLSCSGEIYEEIANVLARAESSYQVK